ncbi:MAG: dTDP-4-dehydrorhamnose reductase [Thermoguttaceae bacterium]|nr:dTDP-4-dehydrorhamnose reductase [Thermoguttaceae bacterium]MDO4426459.1 dTDP-4-dehydrorhamnose reductase [Planctomycetia bacterium]
MEMSGKYLVLGAKGQLGTELTLRLGERALPVDLPDGDITDKYAVQDLLDALKPAAVLNAAAFTAVDAAERQPAVCRRVNAAGPLYLAQECEKRGLPLLHVSTDYVFCGTQKRAPLTEEDEPVPQGVYAVTKLEGERNIQKTHEKHIILRTCGLYGKLGANTQGNFVETMRRIGAERRNLRVVNDQFCTPTWVPNLAAAALWLLENEKWGLFHVVDSGETTWFDFAKEIFRLCALAVEMTPISTAEWNAPSPRPLYSVLDTSKYHVLGGPKMLRWQESLEKYLAQR